MHVPVVAAVAAVFASSPVAAAEFLAVSELHRNPVGLESVAPGGRSHEFVEILNIGDTPLSLDSVFLSDGLDADSVIAWHDPNAIHRGCVSGVRVLEPGQVAVVLDPDYDSAVGLDRTSAYRIADGTVLWTVGDSHLGDYSNLSETDGVFLYKGTQSVVQRVLAFAADTGVQVPPEPGSKLVLGSVSSPEGRSVVLRSLLFGWPVFAACPEGVSPGAAECVVDGWLVDWRLGAARGGAAACTLAAARVGGGGEDARVEVEREDGFAGPVPPTALGVDANGIARFATQVPLDSQQYYIVVTHGQQVVRVPLDLSSVWVPAGALRVSEVFPRAGEGGPEWFELVNVSPMSVSLEGWLAGDSEDSVALAPAGRSVAPGAYVVFTEDAEALGGWYPTLGDMVEPPVWHTLANTRDSLCLWDNHGQCHECVYYDAAWYDDWVHGSLERVTLSGSALSAQAWAAADPPSPGQPNGSSTWRAVARAAMDIGPLPFTPNGDGVDEQLSIRLQLPAGATVSIAVYGMDGRVVRTLPDTPREQYLWDGRTDSGSAAPVGPFFVVARFSGISSGPSLLRKRGVLWR